MNSKQSDPSLAIHEIANRRRSNLPYEDIVSKLAKVALQKPFVFSLNIYRATGVWVLSSVELLALRIMETSIIKGDKDYVFKAFCECNTRLWQIHNDNLVTGNIYGRNSYVRLCASNMSHTLELSNGKIEHMILRLLEDGMIHNIISLSKLRSFSIANIRHRKRVELFLDEETERAIFDIVLSDNFSESLMESIKFPPTPNFIPAISSVFYNFCVIFYEFNRSSQHSMVQGTYHNFLDYAVMPVRGLRERDIALQAFTALCLDYDLPTSRYYSCLSINGESVCNERDGIVQVFYFVVYTKALQLFTSRYGYSIDKFYDDVIFNNKFNFLYFFVNGDSLSPSDRQRLGNLQDENLTLACDLAKEFFMKNYEDSDDENRLMMLFDLFMFHYSVNTYRSFTGDYARYDFYFVKKFKSFILKTIVDF